jgi:GTPase
MLQHRLSKQVPELAGVPVLPVSALTGSGADRLLPAVMAAYDVWTWRVPTSRLNRWLEKVTQRKSPCSSMFHGRPLGRLQWDSGPLGCMLAS